MAAGSIPTTGLYSPRPTFFLPMLVVGLAVFVASMFGILTRPVGALAAFWPANAILLGLMVRNPHFNSAWGWGVAFLAYIAADLLTGGSLERTLWLTAANLLGASAGVLLYTFLSEDDRKLRRPVSMLYLFGICGVSAFAAAIAGGGAARMVFGRDFLTGFEFWYVTEFVNSLVILPVILSFPGRDEWRLADPMKLVHPFGQLDCTALAFKILPIVALIGSIVVAQVIGGPGVIAFPVPALIWCALSFPVFPTAVITMLLCAWLLIAAAMGTLALPPMTDSLASLTSFRLGVALSALGPLTVAAINSARNDLLAKLSYAADHDQLTGALSRGAVMRRAEIMLARKQYDPVAIMMVDIDHFKKINDRYGHAVGDQTLIEFVRTTQGCLRSGDLLGRIGGEEFVVVLPNTSLSRAKQLAEKMRRDLAARRGDVSPDLMITASFGIACTAAHRSAGLDCLLSIADRALYRAKETGRNKVVLSS